MPIIVVLTQEQLRLEQEADALLAAHPVNNECPAYTDRQMERRGAMLRIPVERIAELPALPSQSLRDELRFLASVTELTVAQRFCFKLWIDGWSQQEIAAKLRASQQHVARHLHHALVSCYDSTPLSFRHFCRKAIYRTPVKSRADSRARACYHCGEMYSGRIGNGRYCSPTCKQAARRAVKDSR